MNCNLLGQIRKISGTSTLLNQSKNHYDSLGLSKNATQADVKTAYYKLSKVYHPDKNKGNDEHSKRFRDISEAYEILGNVKTRKMYDKGFYMGHSHSASATTEDPLHKFYQSRERRSKPPAPTGRTPIYDFDEWAKSHYGETFRRSQENKQRIERLKRDYEDKKNHNKYEVLILSFLGLFGLCMYLSKEENKYDNVNLGGGVLPVFVKKKNSDNES